jgi:hypothetical protein
MIEEVQNQLATIHESQGIVVTEVIGDPEMAVPARQRIAADLDAIERRLIVQTRRIESLSAQLERASELRDEDAALIANLRQIVANLQRRILEQERISGALADRLALARIALGAARDTLRSQQETISERDAEISQARDRIGTLEEVYYIVDAPRPLRETGITCRGAIFDRTSLCEIDRSFMTVADRSLSRIVLGEDVDEIKIFTQHADYPQYFDVEESDGTFTLVILDAEAFWSIQRDLVIEVK